MVRCQRAADGGQWSGVREQQTEGSGQRSEVGGRKRKDLLYVFTNKYILNALVGGKMQNLSVDIPDSLWLQNHFAHYAHPRARIARLVRQGELLRLKRGVYIHAESARDAFVKGKAANRIYGPSYVSFAYALRWYGLIPEHVVHITSATFGKGRKKRYDTPAGTFFYQDVPASAYPYGITFMGEAPRRFLMAVPEKALCDELYRVSGIRSMQRIRDLLFDDLRLDPDEFSKLDKKALIHFAAYFQSTTLSTFAKFLGRGLHA